MNKVLELKSISKSYKDGDEEKKVLSDVNLSVEAGEFAAVVGPSGCGKSTLLNIAGLMLSPDYGEVFLGGRNVSDLGPKERAEERRDSIGFIFQSHQLLPYLNVKEQLTVVHPDADGRVDKLLSELGIRSLADKHPSRLSGGECQRVAIARAFMGEARLVLADEPTASLDSARGREVVEMIRQETKAYHKAALMVTHDERVLDLVDTVYKMSDGVLVADGSRR